MFIEHFKAKDFKAFSIFLSVDESHVVREIILIFSHLLIKLLINEFKRGLLAFRRKEYHIGSVMFVGNRERKGSKDFKPTD